MDQYVGYFGYFFVFFIGFVSFVFAAGWISLHMEMKKARKNNEYEKVGDIVDNIIPVMFGFLISFGFFIVLLFMAF